MLTLLELLWLRLLRGLSSHPTCYLLPRPLRRPVALQTQPSTIAALGLDLVAFLLSLLAHQTPRLDASDTRLGQIRLVGVLLTGEDRRSAVGQAPWATWQTEARAARAGDVSITGLLDLGASMADGASLGRHGGGWGSSLRPVCSVARELSVAGRGSGGGGPEGLVDR